MAVSLSAIESIEDKRHLKREKFYRGDLANVRMEVNSNSFDGHVYDISSNGIGIIVDQETEDEKLISEGTIVKIVLPSHLGATLDGKVINISTVRFSGQSRKKLGISLDNCNIPYNSPSKIACPKIFAPTGYCPDPIFFQRTVLFSIVAFIPDGLIFKSASSLIMYNGFELDTYITIPHSSQHRVRMKVVNCNSNADGSIVTCKYQTIDVKFHEKISEYLLIVDQTLTLQDLREHGFYVSKISKAMHLSTVQNQSDMQKILQLRLISAHHSGRWLDCNDPEKMIDEVDQKSRQLYCSINGTFVAAARLAFNNGIRELSEHSHYKVEIPQWLWEKQFLECSRVCTHPSYRGSDLFVSMIRHLGMIAIQSGYGYVVLNCVDSLVPIYARIGAKRLGIRFKTPYMQEEYLNLLYIDIKKSIVGSPFNPKSLVIGNPLSLYLKNKRGLQLNIFESILININIQAGRLATWLFERVKRRKAKQR